MARHSALQGRARLRWLSALLLFALLSGSGPQARAFGNGPGARGRRVSRHTKPTRRGKPISTREAHAAVHSKTHLRGQLHGVRKKMHAVRARLHDARTREHRITENIETVQARIDRVRRNLARTNSRLARLTAEHVQTTVRLQANRSRLQIRRQLLARRMRDNYARAQTTYAQVLLESRSLHDLLSRGYYVRRIVQSDTELITGIRADIQQIEQDKRLLEAQEREQRELAADYEEQKRAYAGDLARKRELLRGAQEVRAEAQEELDELEAEAEAMTDRIRMLSELLRRRQEEQRRLARLRRQERRPPSSAGEPDEPDVPEPWRGGLLRPCNGPITSGFGYRRHPILGRRKMHTGIDIAAQSGAPIYAAARGTVLLAAYTRGYGNCVILDHGDGRTTLYGHASALLVQSGQVVTRGQVIARVGMTGMATGPHLHFEVRRNGVPVQPF